MKKIITLLSVVIMMACAMPAAAQFKFGVKGGANFANLELAGWKSKNATGWYVGPTAELMLPVVGLGVEGSLLYSRVNTDFYIDNGYDNEHVDYLTLPINLKFKINLPVVKPFLFGGPEFSVRVGDSFGDTFEALGDAVRGSEFRINLGAGVELFNKLQVTAGYNWGMTDTFKHFDSKSNVWRVGVGLYF